MCNRFIEDFVDKVIEKITLENLDTNILRNYRKKCDEIIKQREEEIITELRIEYRFGNYIVKLSSLDSINILLDDDQLIVGFCYYGSGKYVVYNYKKRFEFLTKEEGLNYMFTFIKGSDSQQFYDICLEKINLIEKLQNGYKLELNN